MKRPVILIVVVFFLVSGVLASFCAINFFPYDDSSYEQGFGDLVRAEFELGTGYVAHQKIDDYLRAERIGFVNGTMRSGSSLGADYTELAVDLTRTDANTLIAYIQSQKWMAGNPEWFVNDAHFKPTNQSE